MATGPKFFGFREGKDWICCVFTKSSALNQCPAHSRQALDIFWKRDTGKYL